MNQKFKKCRNKEEKTIFMENKENFIEKDIKNAVEFVKGL